MSSDKPGRHAEIVPKDHSHYVYVDGFPWSRHDTLEIAEAVRTTIVERWASYYEARAAESNCADSIPSKVA
jgi:hypothetical protein